MGSMVSAKMDVVFHEICDWNQSTNMWVIATHIPEMFSIETDKDSRVQEKRTKWMVSKTVFDNIFIQIDFKLDIDLFASRLYKQVLKFGRPKIHSNTCF